jgi:large subunit ribosomal protein L24
MLQSGQRRKQREYRFTAPMHVRQKFTHSHISKDLAKKLGIKKQATQIHKGDTVKVMVGSSKGKTGKVNEVEMRRGVVMIDGISRKNSKGKELPIPIRASNVYITDMDLTDKLRKANLGIKA